MKRTSFIVGVNLVILCCFIAFSNRSCTDVQFDDKKDIVYGYKDGMALVMDVFYPGKSINGACVIYVVSGGMNSNPEYSHKVNDDPVIQALLKEGYAIFAVAHGSQPRYAADEIRKDISRSVRYIRTHAKDFGIDKNRIGIMGSSSGAQLALIAALYPPPADLSSKDPVEQKSSEIQAAVVYFPGTDMLNFGSKDVTILEYFHSLGYYIDAAFDFQYWDTVTNRYERIIDPQKKKDVYFENSPVNHVSENSPPIMLFHGDADKVVPVQQSKILVARLKSEGVKHKFIIAPGEGHGWHPPLDNEIEEVLSWFNQHLLHLR